MIKRNFIKKQDAEIRKFVSFRYLYIMFSYRFILDL